jgi:hypothetical protein
MFQKIVVAYNESPEFERTLASEIQLARSLNAELQTVTVMADLSAYPKSMKRIGGLASVL